MPINRTVRFFRVRLATAEDEVPQPIDQADLDDLIQQLADAPPERLVHPRRGRELEGYVGRHDSAHRGQYIYLGKIRTASDLPDDLGDGVATSLAHNATVRRVSEPCYIVATGIDSSVAVLSTQGGAKSADVAHWLTQSINLQLDTDLFDLSPITSDRQLDLLERAQFVSKLDVQRTPGGRDRGDEADGGQMDAALDAVAEVGGGEATVYVRTSFGHTLPDTIAGRRFTEEAKRFLRDGEYDKAVANLKVLDEEGAGWVTEQVDFVRDLVTCKVQLGERPEDPLEADRVIWEMVQAIRANAELLRIN